MRELVVFIFMTSSSFLFSQNIYLNDSLILYGVVKTENNNELLPFARIDLMRNNLHSYSDLSGNFILVVKNYTTLLFLPDTLVINFTGLKTYKKRIGSMDELREIFNNSISFSNHSIKTEELKPQIFILEEPSDGYVIVVPSPSLWHRIKTRLKRKKQ